jgi:transposase-like protein
MTDTRPYCPFCHTRMSCVQNGVVIPYSDDQVQRGDLYRCLDCGNSVIVDFGLPYYSPEEAKRLKEETGEL